MKKLIALLAMTSLSATPAAASVRDVAFSSSADQARAQTSMFAGASYRVVLGGTGENPRSRASLKLSGMMKVPGASEIRFGQGLEVARGIAGKPALFVAGRDVGKLGDQARLGSGGTIALVVVGLVVVAGGAAALAIDARDDRLDRQNVE
jgi:hypothetical protein